MAPLIAGAKASLPAFKEGKGAGIQKFNITSNEDTGKSVSILNGIVELRYYESILQDTKRATVAFTDTGESINGKSVVEGLPIYGSEPAFIKVEDNNNNEIEMKLYVNKPTQLTDDTRKTLVSLSLASKEFFDNEKVRLNTRFNGKISDHVKEILENPVYLGTEKELDIEPTSNSRNFVGNNKKPFYTINWLSRGAVPSSNAAARKNSAGFFFYETQEGFHFRSIDGLLDRNTNPIKKKYIYNETPEGPCSANMPDGYDAKILEYSVDNKVNVQEKLKLGAYSTRIITFNPFDTRFAVNYPNAQVNESIASANGDGSHQYLKMAGTNLPYLNEEFNKDGTSGKEFSRTTFMVLDSGSLPEGWGVGEKQQSGSGQVAKSKDENNKYMEVLNQGIMRMNQLFSLQVTITIPGDFSLKAGDMVYVDAPQLQENTKSDEANQFTGGEYVIANLCHYLSSKHTLTKLDLVRDSFGRKPPERNNATSRTGSFQDRRNWRRSSSAAARANTNKYGQNIKTTPSSNKRQMGRSAAKNRSKRR